MSIPPLIHLLRSLMAAAVLSAVSSAAAFAQGGPDPIQKTYQVAAAEILTIRERIDRAYRSGDYRGLTQARAIRRGLISLRTTVRGFELFSTLRAPMRLGGSESGAGYYIQFEGVGPRICYPLVRETLNPEPPPRSELVAVVVNGQAIRAPIDLGAVDDACDLADEADSTVLWVFR